MLGGFAMKMYQLVAPTSMGVRITPTVRQPVHVSDTFFMQATSAESNVLSIPAALGLKTKVLTTFAGLKENVIIGKLIPAGTGLPEVEEELVHAEEARDAAEAAYDH